MDSCGLCRSILLALAVLAALVSSQEGGRTWGHVERVTGDGEVIVEGSRGFLFPTRTAGAAARSQVIQATSAAGGARGGLASGRRPGPPSQPTTTPKNYDESRKTPSSSSPDIRDIITGFVKLLNGNVQIAANPSGHVPGGRPLRTRINNRGPPRITELPPLLLDPPPPSLVPPPPSHPYPFEKPIVKPFVSGVPLPEQIVPTESGLPVFPGSTLPPPARQPTPFKKTPPPPEPPPPPKPDQIPTSAESDDLTLKLSSSSSVVKSTSHSGSLEPTNPSGSSLEIVTNTKHKKISTSSAQGSVIRTTTTVNTASGSIKPTKTSSTPSISSTRPPSPPPPLPPKSISTTQGTTRSTPTSTTTTTAATTTTTTTTTDMPSTSTTAIESSIVEIVTLKDSHKPTSRWDYTKTTAKPNNKPIKGTGSYAPRPGIVLDDPEYKPGLKLPPKPVVTSPPPPRGEVFDVTVSAIQGETAATGQPVVYPVELEGVKLPGAGSGEVSVITTAEAGQHFVSIDGKRTYINLFGSTSEGGPPVSPTSTQRSPIKPTQVLHRPIKRPRPQVPVRIDTCIVGDWSTCDADQHETCRTEAGVSSCHCSPGYSRRSHRTPCKRVVSIVASIQLEKFYEQKLVWSDKLADPDSQEYLQLEYEMNRAMESAMSMTPFSDAFMGSKVNRVYTTPGSVMRPVLVNVTMRVEESPETLRPSLKGEVQRQLLGALQRRNGNLGTSALWASPSNPVSLVQDLDECVSPELNDCHAAATCINTFGSFECTCPSGYRDEHSGSIARAGRRCITCGPEHCNHRGTCSYSPTGQPVCSCSGNYYGSQCEVDGEVLGVAIGASVAAVVIILSTLACLCMWSRRWNKEQKVAGMGSPVFGYMPSGGSTVKTPGVGAPPYQVSLEDRLRWAQIADAMAHATNHYAPEPVATRPGSALYGYGGTLPIAPVPLPRLGVRPAASVHNMRQDSSSEEEDKADLLGRNFHVPRPKSRSSIANQSGIYYDVDYEQQDHFSTTKQHPACIPMSTYTMGRSHYYRT